MNYFDFLEMVIDDGIEAAKADYVKPEQKQKLEGSIAGFNACRKKTPEELLKILRESERTAQQCTVISKREKEYWYYRCYQLEVEWTCNVVSAMLYNERLFETHAHYQMRDHKLFPILMLQHGF